MGKVKPSKKGIHDIKIEVNEQVNVVYLIPENELDQYMIGRISEKISNDILFDAHSEYYGVHNQRVSKMIISTDKLIEFLAYAIK